MVLQRPEPDRTMRQICERMDEQILPAMYAFVGASFGASPSQLGWLTLCRALVQALSSPVGGLLGARGAGHHMHHVTHVLAAARVGLSCEK